MVADSSNLVLSEKNVLKKIKERSHLSDKALLSKGINLNHCHTRAARAIRGRSYKPTDLIWLYGDGSQVMHSVLTDSNQKVITGGNFGLSSHRFLGVRGFVVGDEVMDFMRNLTVNNLMKGF